MIRSEVCWDATVRVVAGIAVVAGGELLAELLWSVAFVGWLLALVVLVPTMLYGVYLCLRGLWLVVEEAAREAVEDWPRSAVVADRE